MFAIMAPSDSYLQSLMLKILIVIIHIYSIKKILLYLLYRYCLKFINKTFISIECKFVTYTTFTNVTLRLTANYYTQIYNTVGFDHNLYDNNASRSSTSPH